MKQPLEEGTFHKIKTDLAQLSKKELIANYCQFE